MAKETHVKRRRYSEEQLIGILKEAEAGVPLADLVRKHGISSASVKLQIQSDHPAISE